MDHFWVFGYGSLMWNPGFPFQDSCRARMNGVHRAPCIYSWVHRGTKERPGIVLGLAPGGACVGTAFKIAEDDRDKVIGYLRSRELVTNVYLEVERNLTLQTGRSTFAITYIADTNHEQYAGRLSQVALIKQIKGARGKSGDNESYILDTAAHLRSMNIHDSLMEEIAAELS